MDRKWPASHRRCSAIAKSFLPAPISVGSVWIRVDGSVCSQPSYATKLNSLFLQNRMAQRAAVHVISGPFDGSIDAILQRICPWILALVKRCPVVLVTSAFSVSADGRSRTVPIFGIDEYSAERLPPGPCRGTERRMSYIQSRRALPSTCKSGRIVLAAAHSLRCFGYPSYGRGMYSYSYSTL
jgi:hypothetical protein